MAQVRDAQTSELLGEGTPIEMVLLAKELGRDEILFDGVGAAFDPDLVLTAHEETVAGRQELADDPDMDFIQAQVNPEWEAAGNMVREAKARMRQARERANS